jgi:hypothetical protein
MKAQNNRRLEVRQACYEIAEKSSKIVPLGAPFTSMTLIVAPE